MILKLAAANVLTFNFYRSCEWGLEICKLCHLVVVFDVAASAAVAVDDKDDDIGPQDLLCC